MAEAQLPAPIKSGIHAWNHWRAKKRRTMVDLRRTSLSEASLRGVNLRDAKLWGADLRGADLSGAWFRQADLRGAKFEG